MPDISHVFGDDLMISPTGDLVLSDGAALGLERVLRRLLTAAGEYIWQTGYGAGLPGAVGQVVNEARIGAVIRAQMLQEAAVARVPAPVIVVTSTPDGKVYASIRYADAYTGITQAIPSLPVI